MDYGYDPVNSDLDNHELFYTQFHKLGIFF